MAGHCGEPVEGQLGHFVGHVEQCRHHAGRDRVAACARGATESFECPVVDESVGHTLLHQVFFAGHHRRPRRGGVRVVGSESAFEVDEFVGEHATPKGPVERGVDHDVPDVTAAHGETASCVAGHAVPHDDHLVGGLIG